MNLHKHCRFAIELQTPKVTGQLSDNQRTILDGYKDNGYKVMVSCDNDEVHALGKYTEDVKVKCKYCKQRFKSDQTRANHC